MTQDMTGTAALVTSATRGSGSATARLLAEAGAHVILNGRRQDARALSHQSQPSE